MKTEVVSINGDGTAIVQDVLELKEGDFYADGIRIGTITEVTITFTSRRERFIEDEPK